MLKLDILLNAAGVVLGALLIVRSGDNRLRRFWGLLVVVCSLRMLVDNLGWFERFTEGFGLEERRQLLVFDRMFRWFFFVNILALFPVASLRPGWLTPLRITIFSLPLICATQIGLCYQWFGNHITPLYTLADLFSNLDKLDVQLRLGYFLVSVIVPVAYFLIPFMGGWITLRRRLTAGMYLYIAGALVTQVLYLLFMVGTTLLIFDLYAFAVTFLPTLFTAFYLFNENPLSSPLSGGDPARQARNAAVERHSTVSPVIYKLQEKMTAWMESSHPFTDPQYSIDRLAADLETPRSTVLKAIQYRGFSGFKEYVNYERIQYFKQQVSAMPGTSVKELIFRCGFTSRSSFYRYFTANENISPKEYLNKHFSEE